MDVAFADDKYFAWAKFDAKKFEVRSTNLLITGNEKENKATLSKLMVLCNELVRRNKYDSGVTVTLTDDANYQDFINLMDVGFKANMRFIPYTNKVYYMMPKPIKETKTPCFICGNVSHIDTEPRYLPIEQFLNIDAVRLWPSLIVFMLMIFFSIRRKTVIN